MILVLDAAYAEYVRRNDYEAGIELVANSDNVVMTRTFSKIHGLAALRVGWAYAPRDIYTQIRKVINPSSVSALSQAAARAAMLDQTGAAEARRLIALQRDYLSAAIASLGLRVVPSQTNFILVDFSTPERAVSAFEFLRNHRLVVRPMKGYGLPSCLRITIGTAEQMQLTAQTLGAWLKQPG